ncbi:MAG: hypothetical protein AAF411_09330 [Myxococcota bacterium]
MLVRALAFIAALLPAFAAQADASRQPIGSVTVEAGTLSYTVDDEQRWVPSLRVRGAFWLTRALEAGVYGELAARDLPLKHPGFGGGAFVQLRPRIGFFQAAIAAEAGYLQLPDEQSGYAGAWHVGASAGVGLTIHRRAALLARVGVRHFFGKGASERLGTSISLGLTFDLP